jgi:hypothetical protein
MKLFELLMDAGCPDDNGMSGLPDDNSMAVFAIPNKMGEFQHDSEAMVRKTDTPNGGLPSEYKEVGRCDLIENFIQDFILDYFGENDIVVLELYTLRKDAINEFLDKMIESRLG